MIPIVAGLLMGAAMGGGIAALQKKDILQGALMGGIGGALGGAFMPGVAGAVGGEAVGTAATEAAGSALTSAANPAVLGTEFGVQGAMAGGAPLPGATSGLFGGSGGIGNFLTQNKYALAGGALGGMMAPGQEPERPNQGSIRDYTFSQEQNPLFGQPGQPYFTNQQYTAGAVTPVEDYKAANGGIIALAEGGQTDRYSRPMRTVDPAVTAYNAKLMERANQQYNVNLPPAPNQVPGSVGYVAPPVRTAPVAAAGTTSSDSLSGLTFNPVTQQYEGDYAAPGTKKKNLIDEATGAGQLDNSWVGGNAANGGLMSSYAGGGLSSLGAYSDGGQLLKGPGDGVSDDIPAQIGGRQPARLADGEFVVPARIVSEIGNGSTDAGAKRLYAMMDRVQKGRKKSIGKGKVAVDSKAHRMLPA